jgi:outer membrane lipoprotein-sorting protein
MRAITRRSKNVAAAVLALILMAAAAGATDVTEVLTRMRHAVEPGKDMRATVELAVTNAKGESVRWSGRLYRRSGPDARTRIVFDEPLDLRGTEVMVRHGADGVTHTRVYLPAIRRVRELDADFRGESFLGTDFNYEDLGLTQLDYQQHTLRSDGDEAEGRTCYQVESIPDRGWWYGKIVRCIDKKDYLPRRTEYYDRAGVLWKLRTFDTIKKTDGYPTATQITMQTVPTGTSTRVSLSDIAYDTGLPTSLFEGP